MGRTSDGHGNPDEPIGLPPDPPPPPPGRVSDPLPLAGDKAFGSASDLDRWREFVASMGFKDSEFTPRDRLLWLMGYHAGRERDG